MLIDHERRFALSLKDRIKSYNSILHRPPLLAFDEVDLDGMFKGKCKKKFKRCLGWYLEDMFNEIRNNPDSNYVTCMDEVIKDPSVTLKDFDRTCVSVIYKTPRDLYVDFAKNEILGSRISEAMGIKTEYVVPVKRNKYMAIDFLSGDDCFETFSEFVGIKHLNAYIFSQGDSCVRPWVESLIYSAYSKIPKKNKLQKIMDIEPLIVDALKIYFFKKYIIHDADFCVQNLGVVYSPGYKNLRIAPAYDFEQSLMPGIRTEQGFGLIDDIEYLAKSFPHVLLRVVQELNLDVIKKDKIKSILQQHEPYEDKQKEYFNLINNSMLNLQYYSKEALKNSKKYAKYQSISNMINTFENQM